MFQNKGKLNRYGCSQGLLDMEWNKQQSSEITVAV